MAYWGAVSMLFAEGWRKGSFFVVRLAARGRLFATSRFEFQLVHVILYYTGACSLALLALQPLLLSTKYTYRSCMLLLHCFCRSLTVVYSRSLNVFHISVDPSPF